MLKSKTVAKLIETTLNANNKDEKFRVVYEVGSYKGADINCILKQGKGSIRPIAGYTNVTTPFALEIIVPMQCGEDRVDGIVDVVNGLIGKLNGAVKANVDGGKAVFLFSPLEIGNYETRATAGQSVLIKLEFSVEYSSNVGTKYEMALINNPFHSGSQNTKYFESIEQQTKWFDDRLDNVTFSEILTPNINSLVITQQRYLNPGMVDMSELLMKNYAIIKETKWNDEVKYYYYEVTNATIDAFNLLVVDLKMDTIQTIYFDPKFKFADCQINKAHLSRVYKPANSSNYLFDFRESSPLFEREDIREVAKRPIKREKLHIDITKGASTQINDWFAENVSHWVYYYMSAGKEYQVGFANGDREARELQTIKYTHGKLSDTDLKNSNNVIDGAVVVLVAPVYKGSKKMYLPYEYDLGGASSVGHHAWDMAAIKQFIINNSASSGQEGGGYNNVFAIKNSLQPPMFATERYANLMRVDSNGDLYYDAKDGFADITKTDGVFGYFDVANCLEIMSGSGGTEAVEYCFARVIFQDLTNDLPFYMYGQMYYDEFTKDDIKNNKLQGKLDDTFKYGLEPKLLNEDYSTYRLYIGGNTYDLPVSKTSNSPKFIYKEILSPDITKAILIYDPLNSRNSSNVFTEINTKDFTGFMINIDLSMWFSNDSLDSYLATNKNNLQIMQNNQNARWNQLGINTLGTALTTNKSSAFSSLVNVGTNIASYFKDKDLEMANYNLTLDNMAQSPQTLSALNSNALLIQSVDDLGIYIEFHQPLSREKEIIVETLKKYGYTLNKIGNVKDYDHIREDYNYIEASLENIIKQEFDDNGELIEGNLVLGGEISNAIMEDLRQRFSQGVRFWSGDRVDYSLPNCEKWVREDIE